MTHNDIPQHFQRACDERGIDPHDPQYADQLAFAYGETDGRTGRPVDPASHGIHHALWDTYGAGYCAGCRQIAECFGMNIY